MELKDFWTDEMATMQRFIAINGWTFKYLQKKLE